jgi:hypothetical protein
MDSNHERPGFTQITVNEQPILVPIPQFERARECSLVLRESPTLRFDIPPRDSGARNFEISTIGIFFEVFEREVGHWDDRDLDCETLVSLCHAFWWLRCNPEALRSSEAVQHLKTRIQTDDWVATGSRCANRLVVSLVLGWGDQLAISCNELVYKTTDGDDNLFDVLPSAVCKHSLRKML